MKELTPLEKQQAVSDLIGDWMDDKNINLLAKEGILVYWDSITGENQDYRWHELTVVEAARIAKVMLCPPQYMTHCTSDSIYTAAQERGRVYLEGTRSTRKVNSVYFNYLEHERVTKPVTYLIYQDVISWFFNSKVSPEWKLLKGVVNNILDKLDIDLPRDHVANSHIREIAKNVGYRVCEGASRYYWRIDKNHNNKKWSCLRYPNSKGVFYAIEEEVVNVIVTEVTDKQSKRKIK